MQQRQALWATLAQSGKVRCNSDCGLVVSLWCDRGKGTVDYFAYGAGGDNSWMRASLTEDGKILLNLKLINPVLDGFFMPMYLLSNCC